ncbi:uncharacterized protein LOC117122572 [Anneissia japonica]|uniref:uncharacterized protein LOC117122572 n=1 Tax=Anneissia japonica TaxID=1529436 RepID=UPI0014257F61|nr:uncharacterized protein LOC117122572 [Anneissia japonica]
MQRHYHQKCNHQGRHISLGTLRNEGYWILGGQRQVSKVIKDCVVCKRLRGKVQEQIMADLPEERLTEAPAFTFVGADVFGPWLIRSFKTGSAVQAKRGPAKQIRSDCGTNFEEACNELGHQLVDKDCVKRYLFGRGCEWIFNPPHASHMGGALERLIGMARRILDSVLREVKPSQLTHEVLVTLMAEVSAIINSHPLLPDSDDPELPINLSPNMLLTMKASQITDPEGPFNQNDLLRNQWRRVQHLSNMFW